MSPQSISGNSIFFCFASWCLLADLYITSIRKLFNRSSLEEACWSTRTVKWLVETLMANVLSEFSVMIFHRLCETTSCILNIPVCPLHLESLQFLFLVLHLIFVSSAVLLEKSSNSFITEWVKEITMHFYPSGGRYRTLLNVLSIWYLFTVSFCEEIDAFVRNSILPSDPFSNLNNQSFKSSGLFSSFCPMSVTVTAWRVLWIFGTDLLLLSARSLCNFFGTPGLCFLL